MGTETENNETAIEIKTVYDLEIHEILIIEGVNILRVPGGWLYSTIENYENHALALPPVFVPYNDEFMVQH